MKNHLGNIRFLLKSADAGNPESAFELNEYLSKMNETIERFEFAFHTGNPVTDAVIHGQYLRAANQSIRFASEFIYPDLSGFDAYELAVILQNALENAVEACEAVPESERFIHLRSRLNNNSFFVEISNSYTGEIFFDSQSGLPLTAKPDAGAHGLGIGNIKRSAQKHNGDIDIRLTENNDIPVFILTVILQNPLVTI
jgi:sensor histidine kinase regulating citrate/malate metabolism